MKIVWNTNHIRAVHDDNQDIDDMYPTTNYVLTCTEPPVFTEGYTLAPSYRQPTDFAKETGLSYVDNVWILNLSKIKEISITRLERAVGKTRQKFATAQPLQDTVYRLKQEHAQYYANTGYSGNPPPLVKAESEAQGITPKEAAQYILTTASGWIHVVASIEVIRQGKKKLIAAAKNENEVITYLNQGLTELKGVSLP